MKLTFNQEYFESTLASFDYDAEKMPLGKLSKRTLMDGYEKLKQLAALLNAPQLAGPTNALAVQDLGNSYLSTIPHVFSLTTRPPVLSDMALVKKEIEMLESWTEMQLASEIMKASGKKGNEQKSTLDIQYQGLAMQEMTPLDPRTPEFIELRNYLQNSSGHTHDFQYHVQEIF